MAYYYVYTPFSSAKGNAKACYNGNCQSNGTPCITQSTNACTACANGEACGQQQPCPHCTGITGMTSRSAVDIGGPANSAVRMYVSSNIQSIRTIKTGPNDDGDALCSGSSTPPPGFGWVNEGVKVELWCGPGASGTKVGTVFFGHLRNRITNNIHNNPYGRILGYLGDIDCNCACYKGFHTHMERAGGSVNTWSYGQSISTSFWIYRWSGPDICAF